MNWEEAAAQLSGGPTEAQILDAVALSPGKSAPSPSHANPVPLVCSDGKTYWVKARAQDGLSAELIAGRLASRIEIGPAARIIRVSEHVIPQASRPDKFQGILVGVEDQPGTVNNKDIQAVLGVGQLKPDLISAADRARVIAFQTWLGMQDSQVLVELTTGRIHSIDHGCWASLGASGTLQDPAIVLTDVPGIDISVGRDLTHVQDAVARIEALADADILLALTHIPKEQEWHSTPDRLKAIGRWLAYRRDRVREVMETWARK